MGAAVADEAAHRPRVASRESRHRAHLQWDQHPDPLARREERRISRPGVDDVPPSARADANVRKGEKGTHIVFTRKLTVKKEEDEERQISMLRSYTVFNVAQIDGLPPTIVTPEDAPPLLDDDAQRFIEATRADIRHGGSRACFVPSLDIIQLPQRSDFSTIESYFGTALHELGHNAEPSVMPRRSDFRAQNAARPALPCGIIRAIQGTRAKHRRAYTALAARWWTPRAPELSL